MRPLSSCLTLGISLLSNHEGYAQLMLALQQQMPAFGEGEKVVFAGHSVSHHVFAACAYLGHMMIAQRSPVWVGAAESYLEVDMLIKSLSREEMTVVHLTPLMLVAGDHAINDVASGESDSWKTLLNTAGILATLWLSGPGESSVVRTMFVVHLQQTFNVALEEAARAENCMH